MPRMLVGMLLTALLLGCGRTEGSKEKYFGGETVEHWLAGVKSPDPKARKKAADMLGNIGAVDARAVPALIEAVKDRDAKVRDAAVLALSKIGPPAAAAESVLMEATQDKDATVRTHATAALERVRGTK